MGSVVLAQTVLVHKPSTMMMFETTKRNVAILLAVFLLAQCVEGKKQCSHCRKMFKNREIESHKVGCELLFSSNKTGGKMSNSDARRHFKLQQMKNRLQPMGQFAQLELQRELRKKSRV